MKRIVLFLGIMVLTGCAANRPIPGEAPPIAVPVAAEKEPISLHIRTNPNGGQNPAFSPDGSLIAFLSSPPHIPKNLWVMNADGTGARRLTTKGANAFRWSPDGKSVMVSARRKGYDEILSVDLESGAEKRFPGLTPNASIPEYSPDGRLFAVTVPDAQKIRALWIGTADGKRLDPVTDKINVRSYFWSPDSRSIFYEAGKTYGVGIWQIDLATMETKSLLNKYIGTPEYSPQAGLIAFPNPAKPGEFDVETMKADGSDIRTHKALRLAGRDLKWDAAGRGVYYLGQDKVKVAEADKKEPAPEKEAGPAAPHEAKAKVGLQPVGVTALWHLDLATGEERRLSPAGLHLADFALSPDGKKIVISGLLEKSYNIDVFVLDAASGELTQLTKSRISAWAPVPSPDSRIAFYTNESNIDTIAVIKHTGEVLAAYPGFVAEKDTRLHWLPDSDGLVIFSGRGLYAFSEKGVIDFPDSKDHRAWLYADASIQGDKVLLSAIPRYGENPGLYLLEVADGKFRQTDLRYPQPPDMAADVYLQPRWSMDGKKIAFSDGIDIWTMNAEGAGRAWITNYAESNREETGKPSLATSPIWSVKGDMLCFTLTVYDKQTTYHELWVVKADGAEPRKLFSEAVESQFQAYQPEYTNQPFFDPADERVIFTALSGGVPNIFAVEVKTGTIHQLTETGAIFPALIPEEGVIVYTSLEGDTESLWSMNSDGSGKQPIGIKGLAEKIKAEEAAAIAAEPVKEADKPAGEAKEAAPADVKPSPAQAGAAASSGASTSADTAKKKTPAKKKKPSKKKVPAPDTIKK